MRIKEFHKQVIETEKKWNQKKKHRPPQPDKTAKQISAEKTC